MQYIVYPQRTSWAASKCQTHTPHQQQPQAAAPGEGDRYRHYDALDY
jgi:hypothetical protein